MMREGRAGEGERKEEGVKEREKEGRTFLISSLGILPSELMSVFS